MKRKKKSKETRPESVRRSYRRGVLTGVVATVAVGATVLLVPGLIRHTMAGAQNKDYKTTATWSALRKMDLISTYIQNNYYKKVDTDQMTDDMYAGMFKQLDQYSEYYSPEEYDKYFTRGLSGQFAGLGVALQQDKQKNVFVYRVYSNTPASRAGIKKGDQILQAGKYKASDMDLDEFVQHLQGKEGSQVQVTVYRKSEDRKFTVTMTRRKITIPTVEGKILEDHIGYLEISSFTETTDEQFEKQLNKLKKQGMTSLIVDLRDNGGGVMQSSCNALDTILPKGMMVYTKDKYGRKEVYESDDKESLKIPIAVLVNGNTASASEIFTGALKDRGYATVIGTKTYGKGIVQTVKQLSDGSGFKLTTARYYTPKGVCIQGKGIQPDIKVTYHYSGSKKKAYNWKYDNQVRRAVQELEKKQK